jgi:pimeloyl-ACP methyl ester carboxylesterase
LATSEDIRWPPARTTTWPLTDVLAVIDALCLDAFDLVAYSYGTKTAVQLMLADARVGSVVLAGTGSWMFEGRFEGDLEKMHATGQVFLEGSFDDHPAALLAIPPTWPAVRVLVLNGGEDNPPNDPAEALAALIPGAIALVVGRGNHGSAVVDHEFHVALLDFLRQ